jgi:hypothetical protein
MAINSLTRWGFLAAALLVVLEVGATVMKVEIDTSVLGLDGQNWDLTFDLTKGQSLPNSATISGLAITGGSLTGNATYYSNAGNVDLTVSGQVTLSTFDPAESSFNEYNVNADLGSLITFVLDITSNKEPGPVTPDAFAFFLIDPLTGLPFATTSDPTDADALFVFNIGNADQPDIFCPVTAPCVVVTPVVVAVPEPGGLALVAAALLGLSIAQSRRKFPSTRSLAS